MASVCLPWNQTLDHCCSREYCEQGSAEIRVNRRHPFLLLVTSRHQRWMLHWFCYLNEIDLNREALAVILLRIIKKIFKGSHCTPNQILGKREMTALIP